VNAKLLGRKQVNVQMSGTFLGSWNAWICRLWFLKKSSAFIGGVDDFDFDRGVHEHLGNSKVWGKRQFLVLLWIGKKSIFDPTGEDNGIVLKSIVTDLLEKISILYLLADINQISTPMSLTGLLQRASTTLATFSYIEINWSCKPLLNVMMFSCKVVLTSYRGSQCTQSDTVD